MIKNPLSPIGIGSFRDSVEGIDLENPVDVSRLQAALAGVLNLSVPIAASFSISSAQILNCGDSPVPLVPAPGPGKMLIFDGLLALYKYGTVRYAGSAFDVFAYGGSEYQAFFAFSIGATEDQLLQISSVGFFNLAGVAQLENQPFVFTSYTGSGNPTNGDGTLKGTIYYHTIDLPF